MKSHFPKSLAILLLCIMPSISFAKKTAPKSNQHLTCERIDEILNLATRQALSLARTLQDKEGQLPVSVEKNGVFSGKTNSKKKYNPPKNVTILINF